MRILVIAELFPPDMGEGRTRAFNVVRGLVSLGHRVTVVAAFPHYPRGNIPGRYRWSPLSVECEGELKVIRAFVPALASEVCEACFALCFFCFSCLFALPFVGCVDVVDEA